MTPKQALEAALAESFEDADGEVVTLELGPGLSVEQLQDFERRLPGPLPGDISELLELTRGFEFEPVDEVDFLGELAWGHEAAFPHALPIAPDGFGNFWIVDIDERTGEWGPVYFASHDPPVFVVQSATLADFLTEVLNLGRPGTDSLLNQVHDEDSMRIWDENPGLVSVEQAKAGDDPVLVEFASQLDDTSLRVGQRAT